MLAKVLDSGGVRRPCPTTDTAVLRALRQAVTRLASIPISTLLYGISFLLPEGSQIVLKDHKVSTR